MTKRKTGTREWASQTINCLIGCSHDCRYCYGRHNAVTRFKKTTREQWLKPKMYFDAQKYSRKYKGIVMFPSQHDILPGFVGHCLDVIRRLVQAGNQVLVVTKPHLGVIERICAHGEWRDSVTFRFTIGMMDDRIRQYWEPNAPSVEERLKCLEYAYHERWKTSVSAEPMLEPWNAAALYQLCHPHLSPVREGSPAGEWWIGKLNHIGARVKIETEEDRVKVEMLKHFQTDDLVMKVVRILRGLRSGSEHIRWKESYQAVIDRVEGTA